MNSEHNNNCKQRFKGVENFLRRLAFNLGNSPSQTEVKIISCIPIDVTDLQRKIAQLERELQEAKATVSAEPSLASPIVQTVTFPPGPRKRITEVCNTVSCKKSCDRSLFSSAPESSSARRQKSIVSGLCRSDEPTPNSRHNSSNIPEITEKRCKRNEYCKRIFSKKKKYLKKNWNTQFVYYAQPEDKTPFNSPGISEDLSSKGLMKAREAMSRSYLADILHKQYKPRLIVDEHSLLSDFSTPICRDIIPTYPQSLPYESDVCSCCHGQFQNIDHHLSNRNNTGIYSPIETYHDYDRNSYYDSNLYDLVPVKEKPVKSRNDRETTNCKELKKQVDIRCWPGNVRPKYNSPQMITNFRAAPVRRNFPMTLPVQLKSREERGFEMSPRRAKVSNPIRPQRKVVPSNICCVEFGEVYRKPAKKVKRRQYIESLKRNDAACATTPIDNMDCQTTTASANVNPTEHQTELIDQIKSILQSVLNEVKTNSKLGTVPDQQKKDAVVQKGPSQNMLDGSHLLHSFTYSPYNMNPYAASCSRQMPGGQFTFANIPPGSANCMQHYPLLIQPTAPTNYFRHSSYFNKPACVKRATSAATNTETNQACPNETEKLIKEIYKSLNVHIHNDTAPRDRFKWVSRDSNNSPRQINTEKEASHTARAISEIFRNTNIPDSSDMKDPESSVSKVVDKDNTKLLSKEPSDESQLVTQKKRIWGKRVDSHRQNNDFTDSVTITETFDKETENDAQAEEVDSDEQTDNTVENAATEASDSEIESDDVVIAVEKPVEKKKKKGLFSKMLKIFQPRIARRTIEIQTESESESDSDDYQTVYSQTVSIPKSRKNVINFRMKPQSNMVYSNRPQRNRPMQSPGRHPRTSPYMEQEYRRYWDEKLMFHEDQRPRRSTEFSRDTAGRKKKPVYYQNYEARSAIVQPLRQAPPRMNNHVVPRTEPFDYRAYRQVVANTSTSTDPTYATAHRPGKPRFGNVAPKGLAWMKKHKLGIQCGEQWKKLILEG